MKFAVYDRAFDDIAGAVWDLRADADDEAVELNAYGDGEYVVVSILFDKPEHEQEWQGSTQDDNNDDSDLDDSDLDDDQPGGFADQGVRDDDTDLEDEGTQTGFAPPSRLYYGRR